MRITALKPQPRHPDRLDLFVDGVARLVVASDVAMELGLRAGTEVGEAELERVAAADVRWRAREAALALLGYRARSAAELRRRLLRKQFPADVVDGIAAELAERGHLDDGAFARAFVREHTGRRPRGRGRLLQELRSRGVAAEAAGEAIADVFRDESLDEAALARTAAADWLRRSGARAHGPDARRRLRAYLARRGFFGEPARAVIDEVLPRGAARSG